MFECHFHYVFAPLCEVNSAMADVPKLHFFLILAHCEEQEQPLASNHAINRRTDIMIANIF